MKNNVYKKLNKTFNKVILLLIILLGVYFVKNFYESFGFIDNNTEQTNISENNLLEIYFFDVGQADSILIKEDNKNILIDAGNNEDGENLVNYLKNDLNISSLDMLVGTHPHEDHIGGLDNVINELDIKEILLPDVTTTTKTFEEVIDAIDKKNYKITIPKIDEEYNIGNMNFKVLYTGVNESDLNASSIVIKLNYFNTNYLFMGDAPTKVEKEILNKDLESDVLKVGHHGSNYSTSQDFLDKVNPKYAIISVGLNNIYKHPSSKVIDKLNKKNIEIYETDKDGTIKLTSDGENINFVKLDTNIDG